MSIGVHCLSGLLCGGGSYYIAFLCPQGIAPNNILCITYWGYAASQRMAMLYICTSIIQRTINLTFYNTCIVEFCAVSVADAQWHHLRMVNGQYRGLMCNGCRFFQYVPYVPPPLTTSTSSLDKDVEFSPNYTPGNVAYTVYTLNFAGLNFRRL